MSKASRRRNLQEANALTRHIGANLAALERIFDDDALGDSMGFSDGGTARGAVSDPTAARATMETRTRSDERELDRHLAAAARALLAAERITTYYTTAMPAKVEELARLERAAKPGCEIVASCKRTSNGLPYWEETFRTTSMGGILDREYRLGRWAYEFIRTNGRSPTEAEVRARCEGRRVMVAASS